MLTSAPGTPEALFKTLNSKVFYRIFTGMRKVNTLKIVMFNILNKNFL
jgi:hypothetical protein